MLRMFLMWVMVFSVLGAFLFLSGCNDDPNTSNADFSEYNNQDDDDDDDDDDEDDPAAPDVFEFAGESNIEVTYDLGADWDCNFSHDCVDDYLDFIVKAKDYSFPISEDELKQQFIDIFNGIDQILVDPIEFMQFRKEIIDVLNIRFLLDGINNRLLKVVVTNDWETDTYIRKELLFKDPWVGTFRGILLTPQNLDSYPGILAIHGHGDDAETFFNAYFGNEYPSKGYAILMLEMRVNGADYYEDMISREFLLNGFALLGIRLYEIELGYKFLKSIEGVDSSHIGLIGHSGGSVNNNVLIRFDNRFKANITDCMGIYTNNYFGTIIDEAVPGLYKYHLLINDFSTATIPVKEVPYGFPNGSDELFVFFDKYLKF